MANSLLEKPHTKVEANARLAAINVEMNNLFNQAIQIAADFGLAYTPHLEGYRIVDEDSYNSGWDSSSC